MWRKEGPNWFKTFSEGRLGEENFCGMSRGNSAKQKDTKTPCIRSLDLGTPIRDNLLSPEAGAKLMMGHNTKVVNVI